MYKRRTDRKVRRKHKTTIEQDIIASLKKRIRRDELEDDEWLRFRDQIQEGDEIWYYKTPPETWAKCFPLSGLEGYALVRDDKVVDMILLSIS